MLGGTFTGVEESFVMRLRAWHRGGVAAVVRVRI